jgi:Cu/Ag efflux protein CusF
MKKIAVVLAIMVVVVSLVSLAFAAGMEGMQKGTIKKVDVKTHKVVFCEEGTNKDITLNADKSIDLANLKTGEKVEVSIVKHTLMHVMAVSTEAPAAPAAKPKAPVGC